MFKLIFFIGSLSFFLLADEIPQVRAVIESPSRTMLSSEIGGKILFLEKNNGDSFKKDETLVKIECDVYRVQRDKIGVKAALARTKLKKNQQLNEYNSVGIFDVETSKLELQEQELEYKVASINVQRCEIKAPFSGRIVNRVASKYQNIKPQEELFEIVGSDYLEIKTVVPATWLRWLKIGHKVVLKMDEIEKEIQSEILQIDSVVDPKSQTVTLRAKVSDTKDIIAGMSGTLYFITSTK